MEGKILSGIGDAYANQGKHEEALEMYRKAQRIFRKTLGPDCNLVGGMILTTASVLDAQGKFAEAIEKYEEGLAVQRRALGPEHPDLVEFLHSMAMCKEKNGDVAGAVASLREAQGICRRGGAFCRNAAKIDAALARLEGGL